jgi:lipopolysaccharide export system protein LptC
MSSVKQAFFLFASMLLLASSGWYFVSSNPVLRIDAKTLFSTTDTTISNFSFRQYSQSGKLANSLRSPLVRHIPEKNTHLVKSPHITVSQENQADWEITAEHAIALYGGQKITFKNHVNIHQEAGAHNQESTFTTEQITYFPKTKHAITSYDVQFEQPGSVIQSKGMKAFLETKRVMLLSQARGHYVPKQG